MPRNTIEHPQATFRKPTVQTLATYAQGVKEADDSLKMLMDWAKKRDRETIIVLFGDHLPPLNTVYTEHRLHEGQVATAQGRRSTQMKARA